MLFFFFCSCDHFSDIIHDNRFLSSFRIDSSFLSSSSLYSAGFFVLRTINPWNIAVFAKLTKYAFWPLFVYACLRCYFTYSKSDNSLDNRFSSSFGIYRWFLPKLLHKRRNYVRPMTIFRVLPIQGRPHFSRNHIFPLSSALLHSFFFLFFVEIQRDGDKRERRAGG